MKIQKLIISTLFIIFVLSAKAQNPDFDLQKLKDYSSYQLENGFTIINLQTDDTSLVSLRLYTDIPQIAPKQYRAFTEIEHIVRKSNYLNLPRNWDTEKLNKFNIILQKDAYGYFLTCPIKNLDTAVFLLSGFLKEPLLKASQLKKIKQSDKLFHDSLNQSIDYKIENITKKIIYGENSPENLRAKEEDINALLISKYENYFSLFYRPNNSYLIFAGNVPEQRRIMYAQKYFGALKKKEVPQFNYKLNEIKEGKIAFFDSLPNNNYEISMIFPFSLHPFTFDYEKSELLSLLIQKILKQKLIVENHQINEIHAGFQNDKISGNYRLDLKLTQNNPAKVIDVIHQTIEELKRGEYPKEYLEKSKQELIESFKSQGNDTRALTALIIKTETNNLSPGYYANFISEIKNTGKQGIQSLAKKYLYYQASVLTLKAKWYPSLNDILELSKNYRIELYDINGTIKKVIPKGFNGFDVLNNFVKASGGKNEIKKIKDLSLYIKGKYHMNNEDFFILGEIKHKSSNMYYQNFSLVRPKKDTLLLNILKYNQSLGTDSTMQGKKILNGTALELLKYKSALIPEMYYADWNFKPEILRADTLKGNYVWMVRFTNPAKQTITDYYDVDKGIRYKRIVEDNNYFKKRIIIYKDYRKIENTPLLYPFYQEIKAKNSLMQFVIEKVDTKKIDKNLFDIN
ncbi:MAG: insulinase family protein [Bacteroidales bacterium]|nr:insulinase family protein [Bacteroidales bacterium]